MLAFSLALSLTSTTALASVGAPAGDSGQAEAEAMFRRGQAKYETADYNGAIELWTEAYALVGSIPDNAAIQALLIYNLAQAHIKAFQLDEDRIHLKQAEQLLRSFEANLETVYEDPKQRATEQAKIDEALADIAAQSVAPDPEPEPEDPVEGPAEPESNTNEPIPQQDTPAKPAKPLLIAGGVLAGVGLGVGALAIVGAVQASRANNVDDLDPLDYDAREQRFSTGQRANTLIIVGSVGGGVLVTTGVALLVVGALRSKQARQNSTAARPILAPSFGPASAGLSLSGRF